MPHEPSFRHRLPDEEVTYLQTDIGEGRATKTLDRDPSPDAKTARRRRRVWFAAEEAPEVETEPGRKDTLPEAGEVKRPKRRGAKDTGEALLNSALEQSEGHVH